MFGNLAERRLWSSHASRGRRTVFRALFWGQIILLSLMLGFGTTYALGQYLSSAWVSVLAYPIALELALVLRILLYVSIGIAIILGFYRRLARRKRLIDQSLKDRLRQAVSKTQQRMMIKKPVRPLILPGSANAANIGRNRIIVGEKLVQNMDDRELTGIIGHELAHGIRHHVLVKAMIFPSVLILGIGLFVITGSAPDSIVLVWTIFAGLILAEMPLSWKMEYSADHGSAEFLGKALMIGALMYLSKMHYDGPTFTHPPLSSRINRLVADRNLQETIAEVPIPYLSPTPPSRESVLESQVAIEKARPVEFPAYVYETANPRFCPICGVQIQAGKQKCCACGTTLTP